MLIDIHGLVIQIHSQSEELTAQVIRPFKYFIKDSGVPAAEIFIEPAEPPYDSFPQMKASFSTPRNIVFRGDGIKIIDYFGKGVVVEENGGRKFTVYGRDPNFLQEAVYLLVLSRFGQYCDKNGILRIHALTFSFGDTAVILSASAGGGKSTMAFVLLGSDNFKLMSDDEALVNSSGCVLPLPIRVGTLDENKIKSIPRSYVYEVDRMEFGRKFFVDLDYWQKRLETRELDKKIYFVAQRLINGDPRIEKISGYGIFKSLIGGAIIGFGLYQGMEFVFNNPLRDTLSLLSVFYKRTVSAIRFARETTGYRILLSRDTEKNFRKFEEFIVNLRM
ncbi:MAG: hypothetical protein AB1598_01580 [Thermodesulfobacteriota bacterium]